jgi:hypothetical protein
LTDNEVAFFQERFIEAECLRLWREEFLLMAVTRRDVSWRQQALSVTCQPHVATCHSVYCTLQSSVSVALSKRFQIIAALCSTKFKTQNLCSLIVFVPLADIIRNSDNFSILHVIMETQFVYCARLIQRILYI